MYIWTIVGEKSSLSVLTVDSYHLRTGEQSYLKKVRSPGAVLARIPILEGGRGYCAKQTAVLVQFDKEPATTP